MHLGRFCRLTILSVTVLGLHCRNSHSQLPEVFTYQNPISSGIDSNGLRDCQVFQDGEWWYLTGTSYPHWARQETGGQLNKGVVLYRSKDLLQWEFRKYIVPAGGPSKWYYRRFWAPEVHKIQGKYFATFNCRNDSLGYIGQFAGYAVADHAEGPYTVVTENKPLTEGNDLTLFEDDDGKIWAFWNRGRKFGIRFAQLDLEKAAFLTTPQTAIFPAQVTLDISPAGDTLTVPGYDGRPIPKVKQYHDWDAIGIEGAYVIKEKGKYYLFYSSWTRGYEIGYAVADQITGPWTKYAANPVYGAQNRETCAQNGLPFTGDPESPYNAVGHNEVFRGPDGRLWLSCHGIQSDGIPKLVIDPIAIDAQGHLQIKGPTFKVQQINLVR
mgnify:CR=1 FL=1